VDGFVPVPVAGKSPDHLGGGELWGVRHAHRIGSAVEAAREEEALHKSLRAAFGGEAILGDRLGPAGLAMTSAEVP
jgi:hypothetical protein